MMSTRGASQLLCLCLLTVLQGTLFGPTFANGAPSKDDDRWASWQPKHGGGGWKDASLERPVEVDVVVVGGGYSGMSAAHVLQQAGLKTVVLEARDVLGGRSRSQRLDSGPGLIELGATWINKDSQPAVFALTQEFGLETIEQYVTGDFVRESIDGTIHRSPDDSPPETEEGLAAAALQGEVVDAILEAVEGINITVFDEFPVEQDVSFADWVAQKGLWEYPSVQAVCSQLSSSIVGREPREVGAHYFFDYLKSGRGLESLLTDGKLGAQSLMIKEGTTAIPTSIADTMAAGSVLTNSPVTKIEQKDDHITITTETGGRFKAKKAILATIPNSYNDIEFLPSLPSAKQELGSKSLPGIYAKVILTYTEAWWRDAGLMGKFFSNIGPVCFSWEMSVPSLSQYSLALFVAGDIATNWHALPESERNGVIVEHLARLVGEDLADRARDTLEINRFEWTGEDYIWGGPTSAMGPGMLRKYGDALRAPFEGLHFAGTETAFAWKGYLEGAVTAGQRAAQEVIEALDAGSKE